MLIKSLKFIRFLLIAGTLLVSGLLAAIAQKPANVYDRYHTPDEINTILREFNRKFPGRTGLSELAVTPGGQRMVMLEIGPEAGKTGRTIPAILVTGNMEGTVPISSEAALYLADLLLSRTEDPSGFTWYILPSGNPDAALRYFRKPLWEDVRNARPHNDDMDDQTDEDGFNDLDGNGIITQMRVKDPMGEWITIGGDPRLMKRADYAKGEKGMFKLYTEGLDDDGDGEYNEDGPGGVNTGTNFPHLFKPYTPVSGAWPGSEEEVFHLMKFVFEHPEIAMTFSFGSTNFCLAPPRGGRRGAVDLENIQIPERYARMLNADPEKTYSIAEIMELMRPLVPSGMEVNESMVAGFLGLGAVVNPLREDLTFYTELSEKYKEYLKEKGAEPKRLDPEPDKDGSFELWSYYHLGVPVFTMDLWTLPEVKKEQKDTGDLTTEKLEAMSADEFVALGEEKITAFLKEMGAPPQYNGGMVIGMVKGGQLNPKQIAAMVKRMAGEKKDTEGADPKEKALLAFSDEVLGGKGFVDWKAFTHPTLGEVEIGGIVPFTHNTPPASMIDSLLALQVPWVFTLAEKLPHLTILKTEAKTIGSGLFEVSAWIANTGYLPFPTAMGSRNRQPAPAVAILDGENIIFMSGTKRTPVNQIGGNKNVKLTWLIQAEKAANLTLTLESKSAWGDKTQIKIGG